MKPIQYPTYYFEQSQKYDIDPAWRDIANDPAIYAQAERVLKESVPDMYKEPDVYKDQPFELLNDPKTALYWLKNKHMWREEDHGPSGSILLMDERRWDVLKLAAQKRMLWMQDDDLNTFWRIVFECARHDPQKTWDMLCRHPVTPIRPDEIIKSIHTHLTTPGVDIYLHPGVPALLHEIANDQPHVLDPWIDRIFQDRGIQNLNATCMMVENAANWQKDNSVVWRHYDEKMEKIYFDMDSDYTYAIYYMIYGDIAWKYAPFKDHIIDRLSKAATYKERWIHAHTPGQPSALRDDTENAWSYTLVDMQPLKAALYTELSQPSAQDWFIQRLSHLASPFIAEIWAQLKEEGKLKKTIENPDLNPYSLYYLRGTYTPEQENFFATKTPYFCVPRDAPYAFDRACAKDLLYAKSPYPRTWMDSIVEHIWTDEKYQWVLYSELERKRREDIHRQDPNMEVRSQHGTHEEMKIDPSIRTRRILEYMAQYLQVQPTEEEYTRWRELIQIQTQIQQVLGQRVNVLRIWEQEIRPTNKQPTALEVEDLLENVHLSP